MLRRCSCWEARFRTSAYGTGLDEAAAGVDEAGGKCDRDVCDCQLPVVTVVRTPFTSSTISSLAKMSKLRPNASGSRLKRPSVGG